MNSTNAFQFFGLVSHDAGGARRIILDNRVQSRLTHEFTSQQKAFLDSSNGIDFDPNYKPEEGDEHFAIKDFTLPDSLKKLWASADAAKALQPDDFDSNRVRSIFALKLTQGGPELIFQNFDRGNVLRRKFSLIARNDSFNEIEETAVTLNSHISAVFSGNTLHFRSIALVSRYLPLESAFREATDAEVRSFLKSGDFAKTDESEFRNISDSWVRKKISTINASKILQKTKLGQLKRTAKECGIELKTTTEGGKERIVLPDQKAELKKVLRLLGQDLLQCSLTFDRFQVNSKTKLK